MKVAVSVDEMGKISRHLGKAKIFYVFDKTDDGLEFIERRVTNGEHTNHIIEDIKDCEAVISGKIGEGMINSLKSNGIKPIVEEKDEDPYEAVMKL